MKWLITGIWTIMLGIGPVSAADMPSWMSADQVSRFLEPGAVWCFEPRDQTCLFLTVTTEPENGKARYDVIQKWNNDTWLNIHAGGTLNPNGTLCEKGIDYINDFDLRDVNGDLLDASAHAEVKVELESYPPDSANLDYCYRYAATNSKTPELITQFQFIKGRRTGDDFSFIMDYSDGAADKYTVRNPTIVNR